LKSPSPPGPRPTILRRHIHGRPAWPTGMVFRRPTRPISKCGCRCHRSRSWRILISTSLCPTSGSLTSVSLQAGACFVRFLTRAFHDGDPDCWSIGLVIPRLGLRIHEFTGSKGTRGCQGPSPWHDDRAGWLMVRFSLDRAHGLAEPWRRRRRRRSDVFGGMGGASFAFGCAPLTLGDDGEA